MIDEMTRRMFTVGGEDLKLHGVPYKQLQSVRCTCSFIVLYFRLQQQKTVQYGPLYESESKNL